MIENKTELIKYLQDQFDNDSRITDTNIFADKVMTDTAIGLLSAIENHKLNGTEKMLCITEYQGIVNIGRAKDNNIATKQPFSKTEIYFSPFIDTDNEICFDSNGYAMLSANDDDTIKTPYHNKRGKVKPIHIIKQELFDQAYKCLCSENQL